MPWWDRRLIIDCTTFSFQALALEPKLQKEQSTKAIVLPLYAEIMHTITVLYHSRGSHQGVPNVM